MNVFERASGRWRNKRQRGVSPIIATILLVAITVVLAAVLYVLISGLVHGTGSAPLGSSFAVGNPSVITGTAGTATYCASGDLCVRLNIEQASGGLTLGDLNFVVENGSGGSTYVTANANGNFYATNINDVPWGHSTTAVAKGGFLSMTSSNNTALSLSSMTYLWIDLGATPSLSGGGANQYFEAVAVAGFSGAITPIQL